MGKNQFSYGRGLLKRILLGIVLGVILVLCLVSLKAFGQTRGYQSECLGGTDGLVILKMWSPVLSGKYKPEEARIDAVHALLYTGIFVGCNPQSPILDDQEKQEKFSKISASVFAKAGWWNSLTVRDVAKENELGDPRYSNIKFYVVSIQKENLLKKLREESILNP
ncbi:MAG: hypothetical protein FJZ78_04585 [Bacteroidetes bacterium]|nr:hypothetical protein [Bacteroidota bacterium]